MPITVGILKETHEGEARVAATPDSVKKLVAAGAQVLAEASAGMNAFYPDESYAAAGAGIMQNRDDILRAAQILFTVQAPPLDVVQNLAAGTIIAGLVNPYMNRDLVAACAARGVSLLAMEMVPRTTRAQAMDALSSQANLAGYRAVIEAASFYGRAFPMMMTAAGTIPPARVFVMGAGVAGLQAIATARRLGAIVSATDVRMAAKEQVESLGATFVMVDDDEVKNAETSGGYAREMSDDFKRKQAALITETIKKQDIVITTAQIPGRPAPRLVTNEMTASMKPGSVIVDMAAGSGGNVEDVITGQAVMKGGVMVVGYANLPGRIAADASALYARNLTALYTLLCPKDAATPVLNMDDDIIKAMTITHQGQVTHDAFK